MDDKPIDWVQWGKDHGGCGKTLKDSSYICGTVILCGDCLAKKYGSGWHDFTKFNKESSR